MKSIIVLTLAALAIAVPQNKGPGGRGAPGPRGGGGSNGGSPRNGGWEGPRGGGYEGPRGGGYEGPRSGGYDGPRGGGPPSGPWPTSVPYGYFPGSSFLEGIGEGIGEQVGYCITTPWNCFVRVEGDKLLYDLQPEAKQLLAEIQAELPEQEAA